MYQCRLAIKEAVEHKFKKGFDQNMLTKYIWPLAINDKVIKPSTKIKIDFLKEMSLFSLMTAGSRQLPL